MAHNFIYTVRDFCHGQFVLFRVKAGLIGSKDKDLYQSAILLKNLSIVRKEFPLSADYMMEEISKMSGSLKPVFQEMLSIYRGGDPESAFDFFEKAVDTKNGTSFSMILSKLDKINPGELVTRLDVFIDMVREARKTQAIREAERNAVVSTALSTALILSLLINFCVVVVFLDTLNTLNSIF